MTRTATAPAQGVLVEEQVAVEPTAMALPANTVETFERLAKDPNVDVVKLQQLIEMQKDIFRTQAEAVFWSAFSDMQGELPTIDEDGRILVDGVIRSRYSTNEKIQETVRPILQRHGFSLTFRNATSDRGFKVTGILAHKAGHKETDEFESKADDGGKMNSIQRIGSTRSYGQRYTTIALLNIVSRARADRDDDAQNAGRAEAPEGYEPWVSILEGEAKNGTKAYEQAWNQSRPEFKTFCANHDRERWNAIKALASGKGKSR